MHLNFTSLLKIISYSNSRFKHSSELSGYLEKINNAKSSATKAKWYYQIISTFHAASAILHNGKYFYNCMVTKIDMDDSKAYLKEQARIHLSEKVSLTTWAGLVREASLKGLDLEELI